MIQRWRGLRAAWRDTLILLKEFLTPLFFFSTIIIGGSFYYRRLSAQVGEPIQSTGEAIYTVLSAAFLQAGAAVAVFGGPKQLTQLVQDN